MLRSKSYTYTMALRPGHIDPDVLSDHVEDTLTEVTSLLE